MLKRLFAFALSLLLSITASAQDEKHSQAFKDAREAVGMKDYEKAAAIIRGVVATSPKMISARHFLGRVYIAQQKYPEALAEFAVALEIDSKDLIAHYERGKIHSTSRNYPGAVEAYRWLKEQSGDKQYEPLMPPQRIASPLTRPSADDERKSTAAEMAQFLLDSIPPSVCEQNQLPQPWLKVVDPNEMLTVQKGGGGDQRPPSLPMSSSLRPKILYQEKARYTELARQNWTSGTVALNVIFTANGEMGDIYVLHGLPDGLSQMAVLAARRIRFEPAQRDSQPVSVRGTLEFTFNLY